MSDAIFGDIIDAGTIERAVTATLKTWLPDYLAHQDRRMIDAAVEMRPGVTWTAGALKFPPSWPLVSDFDIEAQDKLPAAFVVSPGSTGTPTRNQKGEWRKTWRFEVGIVVGGRNEAQCRLLGGLYLAAIIGALIQGDRTLGGIAENTRNVGPDDHSYGITARKQQRAVYGTAFEVDVRTFVNDRLGPTEPSPDPHNPVPFPPSPLEAEITVEYLDPDSA